MAKFHVCDHCGRTGVTFGVYYPERDMTKPPVHLCQTYMGNPIEPNCYHLVVELGEELGLRKATPILATDRHSAKIEAVALRFEESPGGAIYTETDRPAEDVDPTAQPEAFEHPLTGQSIPSTTADTENVIADSVTEAEKGKGIINPHGGDQRPLIMPGTDEANAIHDAAVQEELAKVQLPGGFGGVGAPPNTGSTAVTTERGFGDGSVPGRYPHGPVGGEDQEPDYDELERQADEPQPSEPVSAPGASPTRSPAQVAAEAQAKADAENKAPAKKTAAKKAPVKKAATSSTSDPTAL